jgi:hypothetical protein
MLFLLGRTEAPADEALPAALVWVSPEACFHSDYADAFADAEISVTAAGERLAVPISTAQMEDILRTHPFRLTSLAVTMDGRFWASQALATIDRNLVQYRPIGRVRVDSSTGGPRVILGWPESKLSWNGHVALPAGLEFFGRRWRTSRSELTAQSTYVELVSTGPLPVGAVGKRCRPASVEIAWTALQDALEESVAAKNCEPIEKLRNDELVPLGRALYALTECLTHRRLRKGDAIPARMSAVSYHATALRPAYGPIPCRVLPASIREMLLERRVYSQVSGLLHEIFEGLPELPPVPPRLFTWPPSRPAA